jgi:hypothetical protein
MATRVGALPQVAAASGLRLGMAKIEGGVVQIAAADPKTAFDLFDVKPLQGSKNDLVQRQATFARNEMVRSSSSLVWRFRQAM